MRQIKLKCSSGVLESSPAIKQQNRYPGLPPEHAWQIGFLASKGVKRCSENLVSLRQPQRSQGNPKQHAQMLYLQHIWQIFCLHNCSLVILCSNCPRGLFTGTYCLYSLYKVLAPPKQISYVLPAHALHSPIVVNTMLIKQTAPKKHFTKQITRLLICWEMWLAECHRRRLRLLLLSFFLRRLLHCRQSCLELALCQNLNFRTPTLHNTASFPSCSEKRARLTLHWGN